MTVGVEFMAAQHTKVGYYPPAAETLEDGEDGRWVGDEYQTGHVLVISADECTAIEGTVEALWAFARRLIAALPPGEGGTRAKLLGIMTPPVYAERLP